MKSHMSLMLRGRPGMSMPVTTSIVSSGRLRSTWGRRHAISLPSCTSGIHLALAAAGVKAGDKVAVPEITWIASSAPVAYVGAEPVFVDVDPNSWCMSAIRSLL